MVKGEERRDWIPLRHSTGVWAILTKGKPLIVTWSVPIVKKNNKEAGVDPWKKWDKAKDAYR